MRWSGHNISSRLSFALSRRKQGFESPREPPIISMTYILEIRQCPVRVPSGFASVSRRVCFGQEGPGARQKQAANLDPLLASTLGRARRGKLLEHMQVQTTARYARLAADPVKDPADQVAASIAASINQAT